MYLNRCQAKVDIDEICSVRMKLSLRDYVIRQGRIKTSTKTVKTYAEAASSRRWVPSHDCGVPTYRRSDHTALRLYNPIERNNAWRKFPGVLHPDLEKEFLLAHASCSIQSLPASVKCLDDTLSKRLREAGSLLASEPEYRLISPDEEYNETIC